eukprot:287844_1
MPTFLLHFLINYYLIYAIKGWSNYSHIADWKLSYNISIGETETYIFIKYEGPEWVSLAFGSTQPHLGVYAITYGKLSLADTIPQIFESILDNGETKGTLINECTNNSTCAKLIYSNYENNILSLIIKRNNIEGTLYTYQFSETKNKQLIQWSYSCCTIVWSDGSEHTRTSRSTIIHKNPNLLSSICDYKTFRKQPLLNTGLSLALTIDIPLNIIQIEIYSPFNQWFGISWNSHSNGDAFIVSSGYNGNNKSNITISHYTLTGFTQEEVRKQYYNKWSLDELNINYNKNQISAIGTANLSDLT